MSTRKKVTKRTSKTCSPPKRPPYKFLTRNLKVFYEDSIAFNQIRIKRLYLKNLIDDRYIDEDLKGINYRTFKQNKLLKTLRHIQISSTHKTDIHESLKNSKNLKIFSIDSMTEKTKLNTVAFYLRRLPPAHLQTIKIHLMKDSERNPQGYFKVAKCVRFFPKLENFYRRYRIYSDNQQHVQRELLTLNKSVSRLSKMKQLIYSVGDAEQASFQRVMRRDFAYPGITGLEMFLSYEGLPSYEHMIRLLDSETSHDLDISSDFEDMKPTELRSYHLVQDEIQKMDTEKKDDLGEKSSKLVDVQKYIQDLSDNNSQEESASNDTDSMNSDEPINHAFILKSIMREEIRPFYRFELFPNLKKLHITHEELLYPLGSFVVDGFAALQKLEDLTIRMQYRSVGTHHIFQGFLKLPLLKSFTLVITFLSKSDWALFEQFLTCQNNLESLSLTLMSGPCVRECYLQQGASVERIIKGLSNKNLLRSLELDLVFCSLEAISKGLGSLKMINQFHTLKLQAIDDTVTSQTKGWKRVEGLCKFIKNQKDSLKTLEISLPIAFEENVVTKIGEAFSKLTQLRKLHFLFNSYSCIEVDNLVEYVEYNLQHGVPPKSRKEIAMPANWNPSLAKYLKRLGNLEDLSLKFFIVDSDSSHWLVDVMKILPGLDKLRKVFMRTRSGELFIGMEQKLISAVKELKNVKSIHLSFYDAMGCFFQMLPNLNRIAQEIEQRQITRSDLMF